MEVSEKLRLLADLCDSMPEGVDIGFELNLHQVPSVEVAKQVIDAAKDCGLNQMRTGNLGGGYFGVDGGKLSNEHVRCYFKRGALPVSVETVKSERESFDFSALQCDS